MELLSLQLIFLLCVVLLSLIGFLWPLVWVKVALHRQGQTWVWFLEQGFSAKKTAFELFRFKPKPLMSKVRTSRSHLWAEKRAIHGTLIYIIHMYIRGFIKFGIKVLWRLQFLEYKISVGSDQNWICPDFALFAVSAKLRQQRGKSQDNFNFVCSLLKF